MAADYRIDAEIFRLYPGYRRGLVLGQLLRNGPSSAGLIEQLRMQEAALRERVQGNPAEHPRIAPGGGLPPFRRAAFGLPLLDRGVGATCAAR